ncbi:MAG: sigma-70 family RNA polymerase sigma factor [Candidatus Omnitrophota bacterium]|nr:MAG: sigma-70 family RNA polymerase sigma factor [Candidatus Omnitrophota bacterium]
MEAIKAYLEKIKDIPLLTKKEEEDLIRKAKKGGREARRKIINSNLKLVVNLAKHYSRFGLPLMDLIAEGNIGLMRAIDKFNIRRGYRFSTYAAWWIRQAITRALIDQGRTIRIPVYMSELMAKYKRAKEFLRQKFNREPLRGEVAKKLKLSAERVGEIELWMQKKASLEAPVGDDGESQLGDFMRSKDYADTGKEVEKIFNRERVTHLLDIVNERERMVLDLRFGITDGRTHTLAEVARSLRISRERVRQIEKEALKKLRRNAVTEQKKELEI